MRAPVISSSHRGVPNEKFRVCKRKKRKKKERRRRRSERGARERDREREIDERLNCLLIWWHPFHRSLKLQTFEKAARLLEFIPWKQLGLSIYPFSKTQIWTTSIQKSKKRTANVSRCLAPINQYFPIDCCSLYPYFRYRFSRNASNFDRCWNYVAVLNDPKEQWILFFC